jgi:outer membrane protein assembly factor BamE (lipoprotein component of BamABCDE complex)
MNTRRRAARLTAVLVTGLAVLGLASGCAPELDARGDMIESSRLERLQPGVQKKDDVAQLLGSPSSTAVFDDETWYYIADVEQRYSIFDRDIAERQVVTLRFDSSGVLREIDAHGLERGREVDLVARETPSFGQSPDLIQQVMGNLGRFNRDAAPKGR